MAPEPLPSPAMWQARMNQWLPSQASQAAPLPGTEGEIDGGFDGDSETVILRQTWPRVFPPL